MLSLYEVGSVFAPAQSLTPAEAVELHQRGILCAADFPDLSAQARHAVAAAFEAKLLAGKPRNGTTVVRWGVRRATRVYVGRA